MGGIVGSAQQACQATAHLGDAGEDGAVVILAGSVAAGVEAPHAFAQVGSLGVFHKCHVHRLIEREEILPVAAFGAGGLGGGIYARCRQAGQIVGREPYLVGGHLLEHILPEAGRELRELGRQRAELLSGLALECSALQGKGVVGILEQSLLLGGEREGVAAVVYSLHALSTMDVE